VKTFLQDALNTHYAYIYILLAASELYIVWTSVLHVPIPISLYCRAIVHLFLLIGFAGLALSRAVGIWRGLDLVWVARAGFAAYLLTLAAIITRQWWQVWQMHKERVHEHYL
jgi:hypothetical protein